MSGERILFVTGRLAESSLRELLPSLSSKVGFAFDVSVLGISVAALMSVDFVSRKLRLESKFDRVILPGWCGGDLDLLSQQFQTPFERGPKDLFDLPEHFGGQTKSPPDLSRYDVEILAEINHAPKLSDRELLAQAAKFRDNGADVIDLGCIPDEPWPQVGDAVRRLRSEGFRISIDSFDRGEVEAAIEAGAELVLSANGSNSDWLVGCGGSAGGGSAGASPSRNSVELVVIPDSPADWGSLERTVERLQAASQTFRIDPILEPIGFGFTASLARYFAARRQWPDAAMMMGIGNLTELSEVDSAGINFLLAAICQELNIRSVLTTEVANWCRSAVKEFDLARRLMRHAVVNQVLPKHVNSQLVMLRDLKVREQGEESLLRLASQIRDANFRLFVERGELHILNRDGYWHGTDPYELFDTISQTVPIDAAHAFYLGYELSKATTAMTLGKQYRQDEALQWGLLTVSEKSAHDRRRNV